MQFQGERLIEVLRSQEDGAVEIRSYSGRLRGDVSVAEAVRLAGGDCYVGVGNRRRIRYLRPLLERSALRAGSVFVRRLQNESAMHIAPPWIVEHRPTKLV